MKLYILPLIVLLFIYCIVLYLIFSYQRIIDFTPFYTSAYALLQGTNPYPIQVKMAVNLNPPFFVWVFSPLARLGYRAALIIWSISSLGLGLIGAGIAFRYAFSSENYQKYRLTLYLIYFSFFPILMDTSIVQVGAILLFLIMLGYHFYLTNRHTFAGIAWGIIIALKIFPALLFFYVLKQGRQQVFISMLITFLLAWLLPLLIYGPTIYVQYYTMLTRILWFGDSWNASIYGFMFRLFIDTKYHSHNLVPIEAVYSVVFFIVLIVYWKKLGPATIAGEVQHVNHQPFCLTLAMMIFLSPFGWLYYFSLLIFPLALTFAISFAKEATAVPLYTWTLSFFFINFPQAYVMNKSMHDLSERLGLFSFCFYGLFLLVYQLMRNQQIPGNNAIDIDEIYDNERKRRFVSVIFILFAFGLIVPLNSFLIRLSMTNKNPQETSKIIIGRQLP